VGNRQDRDHFIFNDVNECVGKPTQEFAAGSGKTEARRHLGIVQQELDTPSDFAFEV
jgi:hypothetical protein